MIPATRPSRAAVPGPPATSRATPPNTHAIPAARRPMRAAGDQVRIGFGRLTRARSALRRTFRERPMLRRVLGDCTSVIADTPGEDRRAVVEIDIDAGLGQQ